MLCVQLYLNDSPYEFTFAAGLKRKHNARADRAQEEAIEAGHTSRAAIAKLRRAAKSAAHKPERGLLEDGGAFRGGVMRVCSSQTFWPNSFVFGVFASQQASACLAQLWFSTLTCMKSPA